MVLGTFRGRFGGSPRGRPGVDLGSIWGGQGVTRMAFCCCTGCVQGMYLNTHIVHTVSKQGVLGVFQGDSIVQQRVHMEEEGIAY